MLLKFAEAARAARVDPSAISRAVKTGIISVTLDSQGKRRIDFAELLRVYPHARMPESKVDRVNTTDSTLQNENEVLKIQIEALKSVIASKDELTNAMKERIAALQEIVEFLKSQLNQSNAVRGSLEEKLLALPITQTMPTQKHAMPARDSLGRFLKKE